MGLNNPFLIGFLLCAGLFVIISMMIVHNLQRMGVTINFPIIRFLIPIYAFRYRQIHLKRFGNNGWLFHLWVLSINLALICFVIILFSE